MDHFVLSHKDGDLKMQPVEFLGQAPNLTDPTLRHTLT